MTIYIYKASRRRRRVHTYRTSLREVLRFKNFDDAQALAWCGGPKHQ